MDKRAVNDLPHEYSDQSYEELTMLLQQEPHARLHLERWIILAGWLIWSLIMLILRIQWENKVKYL